MAAALRISGIFYGLPYIFHPDEGRHILETFGMAQAKNLLPINGVYPVLHNYLLLAVYVPIYFIGRVTGAYQAPEDMGLAALLDPTLFIVTARLASVGLGVGTVGIVYLMGMRFFSRPIALTGALFTAVNFLLVHFSQWALPDPLMMFMAAVSFLLMGEWVRRHEPSYLRCAALAAGLSLATKYQGFFLAVPLFLAAWMGPGRSRPGRVGSVCGLFALAAFVGYAGWFFRWDRVVTRLSDLGGSARLGISSSPLFSNNVFDFSFWWGRELLRQQDVMGFLVLAGIGWALLRRTRLDFLFLSFLAVLIFGMSQSSIRYLYLGAILFPLLCLYAARFLVEAVGGMRFRHAKRLATAIGSLAVFIVFVRLAPALWVKTQPDTRELARAWIEEHVPAGETIAIDWYGFGPPVQGEGPPILEGPRDPLTGGGPLSAGLADRYRTAVGKKAAYRVVSMIRPAREPEWPAGMPAEAVERAEKSIFLRRLYSWFRFVDIETLKSQGVRTFVISKFAYNHFLLDGDVHKDALFNPFFLENTLANNRQAAVYRAEHESGLMFHLADRARRYYLAFLLQPEVHGLELVQEFEPSGRHWGPVIKIYRLKEV